MNDNLYDEFGNYVGPDIEEEDIDQQNGMDDMKDDLDDEDRMSVEKRRDEYRGDEIVLHEDKQYYPEAHEVYKGAETLVMEEDAMGIEEPIIGIPKVKNFDLLDKAIPQTTFDYQFLKDLMKTPEVIRNVAIVGAFHHGKTLLMDMLVQQTHTKAWDLGEEYRYTDARLDEQERKLSIKATPMTLLLPDSRDKSYVINLFDTPGHPNFTDEVCCALRMCDGAFLVVDAVEGVMMGTERLLKYLVDQDIAITVIISKIDRLILELRLPPADAYLKIKHTLEEINGIISSSCANQEEAEKRRISPLLNNVAFMSARYGCVFTLQSFAKMYSESFPSIKPDDFVKVLWGDYYFDSTKRTFSRSSSKAFNTRSFVQFILEPVYKIFGHTISKEYSQLQPVLSKLGIYLKKEDFKMNTKDLLKLVCTTFFGNSSCLTDMAVKYIPNSREGTVLKVRQNYTGRENKELIEVIQKCNATEMLVINIVKLYNKPDCLSFDAFGRVLSGTIKKGDSLKILGETYTLEDQEDMTVKTATKLSIKQARYRVDVSEVVAGNWVLIEGIDQSITKTATVTHSENTEALEIFRPTKFNTISTIKVAIEPIIPSELPKMLEGIRKVNKSYPLLTTKVEQSGEHVLLGTGELFIDCVLHDLRKMYTEIEIKIADPSVTFCETIIDTSAIKCYADTLNKRNRVTMISEPLDKGLAEDIEREKIDLSWPTKTVSKFFEEKYQWDLLAARSVWAFGPTKFGPNVLIDDTLPNETDKALLGAVKETISSGFRWATTEGPLCDEPIRNCKFKLIEAKISSEPIFRAGGQVIPAARKVCSSSFLMSSPRVMEPMLLTEIQCSADCLGAIYNVLVRRRGHVVTETAKPGSPLYTVIANVPAIDSFGFETDLRTYTSGQAFCLSVFDHWSILAGDPLDKSIQLKILEPSLPHHLPREFMIKTRRRKGLSEDVSIVKYFDDPLLIESLKKDNDMKNLL